MRATIFFLSLLLSQAQSGQLFRRLSSPSYLTSVCNPNVTSGSTIPPCTSIITIETLCVPNGTLPINYLAHAQCMCSPPSSFFADWRACQRCHLVHGDGSEKRIEYYSAILDTASNSLCTGTPTAAFSAVFSSVVASAKPFSIDTTASDLYPDQTAVSLYYTASGSQGPGAITGSAASATKAASAGSTTGTTREITTGSITTGSSTPAGSTAVLKSSSSSDVKSDAIIIAIESRLIMASIGMSIIAAF